MKNNNSPLQAISIKKTDYINFKIASDKEFYSLYADLYEPTDQYYKNINRAKFAWEFNKPKFKTCYRSGRLGFEIDHNKPSLINIINRFIYKISTSLTKCSYDNNIESTNNLNNISIDALEYYRYNTIQNLKDEYDLYE